MWQQSAATSCLLIHCINKSTQLTTKTHDRLAAENDEHLVEQKRICFSLHNQTSCGSPVTVI